MNKTFTFLCLGALLLFGNCKKEDVASSVNNNNTNTNNNNNTNAEPKESVIELSTDFGTMYIWLYDETPKHKENFIKLAKEGFYNNTTFHRIIPGFMIQGGDPNSKDSDPTNDGQGGPGYTIPAEIMGSLRHKKGAVAAARLPDDINPQKASSGCQFYIAASENGTAHLNGEYTVFGYVMKGVETVDEVLKQPKGAGDRPLTDIKMQVKVLEKTKAEILAEYGYEVK